jgi:hypothetical protein
MVWNDVVCVADPARDRCGDLAHGGKVILLDPVTGSPAVALTVCLGIDILLLVVRARQIQLLSLPAGIPSGGLCVLVSGLLAAVTSRPPFWRGASRSGAPHHQPPALGALYIGRMADQSVLTRSAIALSPPFT